MKGTLALRGLATFAITLCLCASAMRAATTPFSFSGVEGGLGGQPIGMSLSGGFDLDDNATRMYTPLPNGENGSSSIYSSPLHQVWGTFGGWSFSGIADIHVADGPPYWSSGSENLSWDNWIVRATVSGPSVNGLTPTRLNLFYFTGPGGIVGSNLLPPHDPLIAANDGDLQFTMSFSDAQGPAGFLGGRLLTMQTVPEPSAALLFLLALAGLVAQRKWKRV